MMSLRQSSMMLRRCFSVNTPAAAAAADPIQVGFIFSFNIENPKLINFFQGLFVDKIREYGDKKSKAGGKLVEATKATEAELTAELEKVSKSYGGGAGVDMTAFPEFKFADPKVDPINISA